MVEVILGIFSLEGNLFYEGIVLQLCIIANIFLREETVRERRGIYNGCVVGCIPSFCWIIIRKDLEISLVDVAQNR